MMGAKWTCIPKASSSPALLWEQSSTYVTSCLNATSSLRICTSTDRLRSQHCKMGASPLMLVALLTAASLIITIFNYHEAPKSVPIWWDLHGGFSTPPLQCVCHVIEDLGGERERESGWRMFWGFCFKDTAIHVGGFFFTGLPGF
jgi:hypothetical protein